MSRENLFEKYDLTKEEFDRAVEQAVHLGSIFNVAAMLALADLLANGDIEKSVES